MKILLGMLLTLAILVCLVGIGWTSWQSYILDQRLSSLEVKFENLPLPTGNVQKLGENKNVVGTTNNTNVVQPPNNTGANDIRDHAVFVTSSTNPDSFTDTSTATFLHGSVPEIVALTQTTAAGDAGDLLMYFPSFENFTGPGTENIVMAKSTDAGKTWSERTTIVIADKVNQGAAVDPSVIQLEDGSLRLYYFGPSGPVGGDPAADTGDHIIYSAVSDDGINFSAEAGERVAAERITDPDVIYHLGRWLMYISVGQSTDIYASTDGLTFERTAFSWSGGGVPGAYVDEDDVVHLYGCSKAGIVTQTASDGVTFEPTTQPVTALQTTGMICDPSPVLLDDGTIVMAYKKIVSD